MFHNGGPPAPIENIKGEENKDIRAFLRSLTEKGKKVLKTNPKV